jgi:hypothetical protein
MGNLMRYLSVLHRVKAKKTVEILALGGSITAGGYLNEFARTLEQKEGYKVTIHNHGHGATEIQCMHSTVRTTQMQLLTCFYVVCRADSIFCVDIEKYIPDLVLIDFAVNDYGPPKLMDALIRKVLYNSSSALYGLVFCLRPAVWCVAPAGLAGLVACVTVHAHGLYAGRALVY